MKTALDNTQRIFQVVCQNTGKQFFCNIAELDDNIEVSGFVNYKVYHFWNNKPKVASKKMLREMREAIGYPMAWINFPVPFHRGSGEVAILGKRGKYPNESYEFVGIKDGIPDTYIDGKGNEKLLTRNTSIYNDGIRMLNKTILI